MKLEEIIKAVEEKELGGDVVKAIRALDRTAEIEKLTKELESEQGKSAAILEDKKKYKGRAETAENKLSEIEKAKLPEDERHKQELQELRAKLEDAEKAREADKAEFAKTQREAKLADLTGSIRWAEGTPHDTAKLIISNALTEIDLTDQTKVDEVLKSVRETHKSFIAAEAPAGTGGKGGSSGKSGGGDDVAPSMKDLIADAWSGN